MDSKWLNGVGHLVVGEGGAYLFKGLGRLMNNIILSGRTKYLLRDNLSITLRSWQACIKIVPPLRKMSVYITKPYL